MFFRCQIMKQKLLQRFDYTNRKLISKLISMMTMFKKSAYIEKSIVLPIGIFWVYMLECVGTTVKNKNEKSINWIETNLMDRTCKRLVQELYIMSFHVLHTITAIHVIRIPSKLDRCHRLTLVMWKLFDYKTYYNYHTRLIICECKHHISFTVSFPNQMKVSQLF